MTPPIGVDQNRARATAIGAVAIVLWSSLALFTTETAGVPPFEVLGLSFSGGFIGSLMVIASGGRSRLARLRQPLPVWAVGFVGIFGYHALYFTALKAAPPAEASLLNYLWPLLIVLLTAFLPGERLLRGHVAGALLGLAGTAVILLGRPEQAEAAGTAGGYAAAAGAAFVWAGYSVLNRRFADVPSDVIGGVCGLVALAGLTCHAAFEQWVSPDAAQWGAIVALGVGPVGLAFFAWDHATKHGRLVTLGTLSYLAPLLSTLLLLAFGKTRAGLPLLAAALLIICGAIVAATAGRRLFSNG